MPEDIMKGAPRDGRRLLLKWRGEWWVGFCDNGYDKWVIPSPNDVVTLRQIEPEDWNELRVGHTR